VPAWQRWMPFLLARAARNAPFVERRMARLQRGADAFLSKH
jgi:hypothetical protein